MTEEERLRSLHDLGVLDSQPDPVFDSIAGLAAELCRAPIALLTLVDEERQWFKANVGLAGVDETPRDVSFCNHTIRSDALFEVPDAAADPRFASNPLVVGAPGIRFYAGAPLTLADGARIGSLCVIDRQPRQLSDAQSAALRSLAAIASQTLAMRRELTRQSLLARSEFENRLAESEAMHRRLVESQSELVSLSERDGTLVYVSPAYAGHCGMTPAAMVGTSVFEWVDKPDRNAVRQRLEEVFAGGQPNTDENRMQSADGPPRWFSWKNSLSVDASGRVLLLSVGRDVTRRRAVEAELRASQSLLARTGRVSGVGGWELDLASQHLHWSEQTRRLFEAGDDFVPTLEAGLAFFPAEGRPAIVAALEAARTHGTPWDLEVPVVTATGRRLWTRSIGEAEREDGVVVRLLGSIVDITDRATIERELRDLTAILENTPDFVVQTDERGKVFYMNPAARRFAGLAPDAPTTGYTSSDFNTPETNELFRREVVPTVRALGVWAGEARVCGAGGVEIPVSHMVIGHRAADGRVVRYSAVMRDISRAVEARRTLQAQTSALRAVLETIPAIVAVVGPDGRVRIVNSAYERWTGIDRGQAVGAALTADIGPLDDVAATPWIDRALAGETGSFERAVESATGLRHVAGSYSPLRTDEGVVDGFIAVAQDVSEHRREEVRLLQLARRDPLTGLFNRAGFEAEADRLMRDGEGDRLALLFIDLDRFKTINDSHGHPVGDAVLRTFAQRMARLVRAGDVVARLGGDEFAILLAGACAESNRRVADKVVAAAAERIDVDGLPLSIGASVGIALRADITRGWAGLVARADAMLYRAKAAGRGRWVGEEGG